MTQLSTLTTTPGARWINHCNDIDAACSDFIQTDYYLQAPTVCVVAGYPVRVVAGPNIGLDAQ